MLARLHATDGTDRISITELFWRRCLRSHGFSLTGDREFTQPGQDAPVCQIAELINRIRAEWDTKHTLQILNDLDFVVCQEPNGSGGWDDSEISLLRALALEKSLSADDEEKAKYYQDCLGGDFEAILVSNNLGVIRTKMNKCREALALFRDAMFCAKAFPRNLVKAPFYNFAIVIEHLYRHRFIFQPPYLEVLSDVIEWLPCLESLRQDPTKDHEPLNDGQIADAYKAIGKYAYEIKQKRPGFFETKFSYLVPAVDIRGSFGSMADNEDREAAYRAYTQATILASEARYAESINFYLMAGDFARDYAVDSTVQIEHIAEAWRKRQNHEVLSLAEHEEYEKAIDKVQFPPTDRLRHESDKRLIDSIRNQKHARLLSVAEQLVKEQKLNEAKLKYKELLEEQLDDDLKKYVSSSLADLLRNV